LTDGCKNDCNNQEKFIVKKSKGNSQDSDDLNRIEYGYGSGYINGLVTNEKLCFSEGSDSACLNDIKLIEADQAAGVS
jgi:hypothetical protein